MPEMYVTELKLIKVFYHLFMNSQHLVEAGEHLKPENFYITNPNLGASVDLEYLISEFNKVKDASEESLRDFLAKHLNIEIGMNLRANRWAVQSIGMLKLKISKSTN